VLEAALDGSLPLASKQTLITKFTGHFAELSGNKYGAFFVERSFAHADVKRKEIIAKELVLNEEQVASTVQGRVVLFRCRIPQYKGTHATWLQIITKNEAKKRLLKDVISAPAASSPPTIKAKNEKTEPESHKENEDKDGEDGGDREENGHLDEDTKQTVNQQVDPVSELDDLFSGIIHSQAPPKKEKRKTKKAKFIKTEETANTEKKGNEATDQKVRVPQITILAHNRRFLVGAALILPFAFNHGHNKDLYMLLPKTKEKNTLVRNEHNSRPNNCEHTFFCRLKAFPKTTCVLRQI